VSGPSVEPIDAGLLATWWTPLWEFFVHVVVGTAMFVAIALPAVGLDILVTSLAAKNISQPILWGLKAAEYGLFGGDVLLFLTFILRTCWKTGSKFW